MEINKLTDIKNKLNAVYMATRQLPIRADEHDGLLKMAQEVMVGIDDLYNETIRLTNTVDGPRIN